MGLANGDEDMEEELQDMISDAEAAARPAVLFAIAPVKKVSEEQVLVMDKPIDTPLAARKLGENGRCFPYIATCGRELDRWADQFAGDPLSEYWADEIKKAVLRCLLADFFAHLKQTYRTGGHLAALNPGSLKEWPISGQRQLFDVLGGREFVSEAIGVTYNDSFLMEPTKSVSGIAFESGSFYENCQYCPMENCPGRRAKRITEECACLR
jgi:hypothetical protein